MTSFHIQFAENVSPSHFSSEKQKGSFLQLVKPVCVTMVAQRGLSFKKLEVVSLMQYIRVTLLFSLGDGMQ